MVERETYWGAWFESRLSDWWFDDSVDVGHESRLKEDYGADMAHFRRTLIDGAFTSEAHLAEGRSPAHHTVASEKRLIQGNLFEILRARYSLGVPLDQLVDGFHELVEVASEDGTMAQAHDGLWMFAWAAMVGDQEHKDTLKRLAPVSYLRQHPSFLADVFLGVEPVSEEPFYDTPKGKLFHTELHDAYKLAAAGELEAATELHNNYVAKEWLKRHRGTIWYGAHKPSRYTTKAVSFVGYWSFESAAIAKVAGIDDSALEGNDNYPYELAHYND